MEKILSNSIFNSKNKFEVLKKSTSMATSELNKNNDKDNKIEAPKTSPFSLLDLIKKEQRRNSLSQEVDPMDELVEEITKDLKLVQTNDYREDLALANLLIEKTNNNYINGKKIKLVELIFHILKKQLKNENEILMLKLYFLKLEKLVSLLIPLKINISDMLAKLVCQIKSEKRNKNSILFKAGDIGEKLYILLKGSVGILIKKEKKVECTPLEYLKYLIVLYLYQEDTLLFEIIMKNTSIVNIEERAFLTLLHIFKFFYFLKENNRLNKDYLNIFDFISGEKKLNAYIHKKFNYSPMLALEILNYGRNTVEQLYNFYQRKIKEINKLLRFGVTGKALIANFIKRQIRPSIINRPSTQEELLNLLKSYDEGKKKFKNQEEYYQKISGIIEISPNKIIATSVDNYIQRLDFENIFKEIQEDTNEFCEDLDVVLEQPVKLNVNVYYEINQLSDGNLFGELALSDPNSKRTATIITKDDCYFGTIIKQVYDLSLRSAQEKLRMRNILFFTRGPIFKGLSNNIFLNKFFYRFKKNYYRKGDILFKKGEERKSIIFVVKGELELSRYMTLAETTNIINLLGGILDDRYLIYLCNSYFQFNNYFYKFKQNVKCCVLKDKEIIGLEDVTLNGINIFDCICVSTEKTEVYELEYNTFEEAKKYAKIRNNIIDFVNTKRNLFIRILLDQRNTIITNELNKIKKGLNNKSISENNSINLNIKRFLPTTKNVKFSNKNKILDNSKNKLAKAEPIIKNIKAKSPKFFEKSKDAKNSIYTLSTRDVESGKYNSNRITFKKISFSVKDKNKYDLSPRKENNVKEQSTKNKNTKNLLLKKSFFNRNSTIHGDYSSNFMSSTNSVMNNYTNFTKSYKPFIQRISHSRTRKNLIPFFSNSYTKKLKKVKGGVTPIIIKEYQRKFPEIRNDININKFYLDRQSIFDSLLDNDDKSKYEYISKTYRAKSKNEKGILDDKGTIYSYKSKDNENENNNDEQSNVNSKGNQTDLQFYKPKYYNNIKNPGVIDFLLLDNWEEKEQFEQQILSEENL